MEFSKHPARNTGKAATLLVQSVKTKNKRSASYQETDGFVLDGSLYILDLPLFFFFNFQTPKFKAAPVPSLWVLPAILLQLIQL